MTPPARRPRRPGRPLRLLAACATAVAGTLAVPTAAAQPLAPPPQLATDEIPDGWPTAPAVSASSYLLVEAATGQVLAARNPDQRRAVASTVKILSALTVLARADPADEITVPAEAAAVGGATVDLDTGEVWTVGQLLDAVLVRSGNDAAVALALEIAGSVEGFVELMRDDAEALGVEGIELTSPSGLDDANRLSARDLAVLTRAALADTRFREIVGRAEVDLPGIGRQPSRNELLASYPGATGVKTGFTEAAGYALVASAQRDGREIIAVLLDSQSADSRFAEAAALLDHGFGALTAIPVGARTGLRLAGGEVVLHAEPVPIVVPADDAVVTPVLALPVEVPPAGEVREAPVLWDEQELARLSVVVGEPARPEADGGAALGRAVVDRVYAAMRAATTTGSWRSTTVS